ncbi:MAG: hypothetical protein KGO81_00015 [Bacteroidota bacterium]|nr:hypothetical protein [Bacteroidota bacterium]
MKKAFTFLLLLVTMVATFYPCCDRDDCCIKEQNAKYPGRNEHKEGCCSPFINCSTCAGFIQLTSFVLIPVVAEQKLVHHSAIIPMEVSAYASSLLQPPRKA